MIHIRIARYIAGCIFIAANIGFASENLQIHRFPFYYDISEFPEATAKRLEEIWYNAIDASMVRVIADPETFDDKSVRIWGVFTATERGLAIYLDRESYEYDIINNAIAISISDSHIKREMMPKIEGHYVQVVGIFKTIGTEADAFYVNGELHEVLPILPTNVHLKDRDAASIYPSPEANSRANWPQ